MSSFKKKKIATKAPVFATDTDTDDILSKGEDTLIPGDSPKPRSRKRIFFWSFFLLVLTFGTVLALRTFETPSSGDGSIFVPSVVGELVQAKAKGTTNILIAGIGGKGHDGADLTDSIMLASLGADANQVTLLSIPRDLYIAYPGGKSAGRINSLYDLGIRDKVGIQYLADKVSEITGQPIDHYMVIDFSGFKQIVDILGGVDIDVPEDLRDTTYPDNNWGFETFSVKKGLQKMNGETALKYARSRHSTSDFDRSTRQQLIIKAIKEKSLSLGYITNPIKLQELYNAVISHLYTDMSLADMAKIGFTFKDISSDKISVASLNNECLSLSKCTPGSFLYAPSRELFGGASVIIPENATSTRLSYYDDIKKFAGLLFRYPMIRTAEKNIVIVTDPKEKAHANEIGMALAKMGFPFSTEKPIITATGTIEKTHINIYWHADMEIGIDPKSPVLEGLRFLEEGIPYTVVDRNEYVNTSGPKIEIVIGKDIGDYFTFIKAPYYLPFVPKPVVSGESPRTSTSSGNTKNSTKISPIKPASSPKSPASVTPQATVPTHPKTNLPAAGEWENF